MMSTLRSYVEAIVLIAVSLVAIWGAQLVPAASPGETWAGVVPMGAAIALLIISMMMIISPILNKSAIVSPSNNEKSEVGKHGTWQVLALFLLAIIYQQCIRWFGYIVPTAIVAPIVFYTFGLRSWWGLVLSILLCPLAYHIIFFKLLGVFPPFGEIFDLMDSIKG